ncbi:pyrroline-5-carboxylate reductase dimerization domain-containing protein [Sinomonas sp. JGH33]|uniref:Pyrroline-5-carboxylate reductase n=1 Tax=Sinomonas terricola TaxID=3110330 RepID=A0ABU5T7L6_9MICC|nr:pyrroline-5-carboxylate reductase dimerization domain-containing protein [Sinomonas sp. JGH33]MEA5455670.1 pyrroline-5-carboxylate reductase dimerization domain-containing protein [Sinomonas sp. JGH33]
MISRQIEESRKAEPREPLRVAVLGAGQLGRSILAGLARSPAREAIELAATTRRPSDLGPDVWAASLEDDARANQTLAAWADVVVLAVRPAQTMPLAAEIAHDVQPGAVVVPLAIGVSAADLERAFPPSVDVVRAMPNLPVELGLGVTGLSPGTHASPGGAALARDLFELVGTVVDVPEDRLDVLAMVSGAGPAYAYFLLEELAAATRGLGFDDAVASTLVRETFHGALALLDASGRAASALLGEIASPGSATERAIAVLEEGALASLSERAMRAAVARSVELRDAIRHA